MSKPYRGMVLNADIKEYTGGVCTLVGTLEGEVGIPFESTAIQAYRAGGLIETENSVYQPVWRNFHDVIAHPALSQKAAAE